MQTMSLDPVARGREPSTPGSVRADGHGSVIGRITGIVVMLLLAGAALVMLGVAVGPRVLPYKTYYVRSGSMEPTIPVGALALYRPVDATQLTAGDVIAFARPGRNGEMVSHRIVRTEVGPEGRGFVTKGDANGAPDDWRIPVQGEGWRYSTHVPVLGYAVGAMGTAQGRLVALLVFGLSLTAVAFLGIWRSSPSDPSLLMPSLPVMAPETQFTSLRQFAGVGAAATPALAKDPPPRGRNDPDPRPPAVVLQLVPDVAADAGSDLQDYLTIISCHTKVLLRSTPEGDLRREGLAAIADAARRAAQVLDGPAAHLAARDGPR